MSCDWTRIEIDGRLADVLDPSPATVPHAILWLHDESGDSPAADPVLTAELRARTLACVAPLAPECWWLDRPCPVFATETSPETYLLGAVLPWVRSRWRQVAVAGVGMGGQGAVRLGFRHPKSVPVVASIAGAFDFHERYGTGTPLDDMYRGREYARQDTAILQVSAHDWPPHIWFACPPAHEWYRGNDRLHEKLAAIGVPHIADLDTSGEPGAFVSPMLTFVAAAMERESRRLA